MSSMCVVSKMLLDRAGSRAKVVPGMSVFDTLMMPFGSAAGALSPPSLEEPPELHAAATNATATAPMIHVNRLTRIVVSPPVELRVVDRLTYRSLDADAIGPGSGPSDDRLCTYP